jgi:hypothetical protein
VAPLPSAVFPGDTLHLMAGFKERPATGIRVTVREATGATQLIAQELGMEVEGDRIPRLAAARRLTQVPEAERSALAVKYQLVSAYTSLVVVAERAAHEKAQQLPTVVPVEHMVVEACAHAAPSTFDLSIFEQTACRSEVVRGPQSPPPSAAPSPAPGKAGGLFSKQARRKPASAAPDAQRAPLSEPAMPEPAYDEYQMEGNDLLALLEARRLAGQELPRTLDELRACGVSPDVLSELRLVCDGTQESEETVVRAFLTILADRAGGLGALMAALASTVLKDRRYRALRSKLYVVVKRLG